MNWKCIGWALILGLASAQYSQAAPNQAAPSLHECEEQARLHSDGHSHRYLSPACADRLLAGALPVARARGASGRIEAIGARNVLRVRIRARSPDGQGWTPLMDNLIAGTQTGLRDIRALSIDEKNQEVLVLDGSQLKAFHTRYAGNVAPIRVVSAPELEGASAVLVLAEREEIAVANAATGRILFFKREASDSGRVARASTGILRAWDGGGSPRALAWAPAADELFVADEGARILTFDLAAPGPVAPKRALRGPATGIVDARAVAYSPATDELSVLGPDGAELRFARTASGDATPR